jgi:tetratricopeptide (TPR) repeat protein/O-antigen ligase
MQYSSPRAVDGWGGTALRNSVAQPLADRLLLAVDAGVLGIVCVAPMFFGGRHDLGRLVFVALVAVTAFAWFVRQAILPAACRVRTAANSVLLAAVALVTLQLIPLPGDLLALVAPRNAELLPLWNAGAEPASFGEWRSLSLIPQQTAKSLAMLISYGLLFVVVAQRIANTQDVWRILRAIAAASVVMAAFGLLQFYTSDGRFFWFFEHPYRSAAHCPLGSFVNRNHFAHFLVLGVGPLAAWLLQAWESRHTDAHTTRTRSRLAAAGASLRATSLAAHVASGALVAALVLVLFAIFRSLSRGGAVALLVAASVLVGIYVVRRIVKPKFIVGLAFLAVLLVVVLSMSGQYERVVARLDDLTGGSLEIMDQNQARRKIWAANMAAIRAGWLTGSGAGSHREIYRAYLPESLNQEFTHAESGFLQIATENGIGGALLLTCGLGLCAAWGMACFRKSSTKEEVICFGAAAAGLAASAAHSLVDFVWYIPACMSVTIVLAACLLRLAQLSQPPAVTTIPRPNQMRRANWCIATALVAIAGAWCVRSFVGPGIAAVHWDRYLRASVAKTELARKQMADLVANRAVESAVDERLLNDMMLGHLEQVVAADPNFARGQLQLAAKLMARFENQQQSAKNAIGLTQVREAAIGGGFASPDQRRAWLQRALGPNLTLLVRARAAAQSAVQLCPLQGEGYIYLAYLSFLDDGIGDHADALVAQALAVRPFDADVLYAVGEREFLAGNFASAVEAWQRSFIHPGPHQAKIVYYLAGHVPAAGFLETFHPDWFTLRDVWTRYRQIGQPADLRTVLDYATAAADRQTREANSIRPEFIWAWLAAMHADLGESDAALQCLERAYAAHPRQYSIRYQLGRALIDAGRFAEAEPHIRWCLARRPADGALKAAIDSINRYRLAERRAEVGS